MLNSPNLQPNYEIPSPTIYRNRRQDIRAAHLEAVYLSRWGWRNFYVIYSVIPYFTVALFFIIPIMLFSLALAFYKFNGKPFIFIVESAAKFTLSNKLYLWQKKEKPVAKKKALTKTTCPFLKCQDCPTASSKT